MLKQQTYGFIITTIAICLMKSKIASAYYYYYNKSYNIEPT